MSNLIRLTQNIKTEQGRSSTSDKLRSMNIELDALQSKVAKEASISLVMNAPVYKIKSGTKFVTVELVDYDIPSGTVTVKAVRGNNKHETVTNLWNFTEGKIL